MNIKELNVHPSDLNRRLRESFSSDKNYKQVTRASCAEVPKLNGRTAVTPIVDQVDEISAKTSSQTKNLTN